MILLWFLPRGQKLGVRPSTWIQMAHFLIASGFCEERFSPSLQDTHMCRKRVILRSRDRYSMHNMFGRYQRKILYISIFTEAVLYGLKVEDTLKSHS